MKYGSTPFIAGENYFAQMKIRFISKYPTQKQRETITKETLKKLEEQYGR